MVNFFLKFSLESKDEKLLHNGADWKRRKVQGRGDKQTFRNRKKQQSSVLLFQENDADKLSYKLTFQ